MAGSSDVNDMSEGTTLIFGSWAYTADVTGGFSSHLVMPNSPKPKATQLADIRETVDPDENRVLLKLSSDNAENMTTPTRTLGSVEFSANSDSEKPHFFEILGKYMTYLKSIKCPNINNSELLDCNTLI